MTDHSPIFERALKGLDEDRPPHTYQLLPPMPEVFQRMRNPTRRTSSFHSELLSDQMTPVSDMSGTE